MRRPRKSLSPFVFDGATAVVTGAASGMGEQMAHQLAQRGCGLVLVDRDGPGLKRVASEIGGTRPIRREVVDLGDAAATTALGERLNAQLPQVDLLINNAGVSVGGAFGELTAAEFDAVMAINLTAPIILCRTLLPGLRRGTEAHVVNVSSLFGLIGVPGQTPYCTSKFGLRGFSESLRHELGPQGIGVTTVYPGGVRTNIARSATVAAAADQERLAAALTTFDSFLTYPAAKAAATILRGVEQRRGRVLIGASSAAPDLIARVTPEHHADLFGRFMRLRRSTRILPEAAGSDTSHSRH